ncbi:MAG: AAA family ATPase [candidate division KSB1 bacterium]|nr:AAA family ATPase [candidate division KSB1 bacterium]
MQQKAKRMNLLTDSGKTPTPEELRKDVSEFLREKYGNNVVVPQDADHMGSGTEEKDDNDNPPRQINFDLKPTQLEAYLKNYVVGQDTAVEILATKICTHFNRMNYEMSNPDSAELLGNIKSNVLMIGPTGVGKTYIIKLIAQKLGVPFVKGDATKFSETGYVGGDVDDLIRNLVHDANGDMKLAEYGIVYLDEIDKIASTGNGVGPDVSRSGVQRTLLKLMEEAEVDLKVPHDLASQMEAAMEAQRTGKVNRKKVNTRNILFVMSGAFNNLDDLIRRRMNQQPIGFTRQDYDVQQVGKEELLKQVKTADLIQYGFENEFIGRLPIVLSLNHLDVAGLYNILKNPKNSVIQGKKRDFKAYGINLEFDDDALHRIAEMAYEEQTGARGLLSVIDNLLLKFEKLLPDTQIDSLKFTASMVEDPDTELENLLTEYYIKKFQRQFLTKNNVVITFTEQAVEKLKEKAANDKQPLDKICSELLEDYDYGLKLLGWEEFSVDESIIDDPKSRLEELIKRAYEKK